MPIPAQYVDYTPTPQDKAPINPGPEHTEAPARLRKWTKKAVTALLSFFRKP